MFFEIYIKFMLLLGLLYEARLQGKITSDFFLDRVTHVSAERNSLEIRIKHFCLVFIVQEVQNFRHGLASLLKYDWVPIPLLYPQVIFMAVRGNFFRFKILIYNIFFKCLKRTSSFASSADNLLCGLVRTTKARFLAIFELFNLSYVCL